VQVRHQVVPRVERLLQRVHVDVHALYQHTNAL
jgi:hypothetical protein